MNFELFSKGFTFLQDRIFDVIDLNAEIEKAKNTLEAADIVFQRHATKFDNQNNEDEQTMSLAQKLDRTRKIANMDLVPEKPKKPKTFLMKWSKVPVEEQEAGQTGRQRRINSLIDTSEIGDPLDALVMKRKLLKRKKSVSF